MNVFHSRWWGRAHIPIVLCIVFFLFVVLFHGLRATDGIDWHPGNDASRDVALAQIILDGNYPEDYLIADEWLWYNPLTGALIAACSWVTELPPPQADVRMAPYLNLAVPLAFAGLVWYVFDGWVALMALASFLFILPQERPTFVSASYSPWLLAPHLMQALFYMTLVAWMARGDRPGMGGSLLAGVLLGLTFLGHAAPAVLLGGTFVLSTLAECGWERRSTPPKKRRHRCFLLGLTLLTAFVISLPFSISILFRYGLHVVNPAPSQWVWGGVALENLPQTLGDLIHWRTPVIAIGVLALWRMPVARFTRNVMLIWPALALLLLAYNYLGQWVGARGVTLPQLVPGYHFLLYLIAAGHVFFGLGVVYLLRHLLQWLGRFPLLQRRVGHPWALPVLTGLVVLLLFVAHYRDFRVWHGFTRDRTVAQKRVVRADNYAPYHWVREHAGPGAVFLCDDFVGLFCVAPAGGKVVASSAEFMSPYVDYVPRAAAREGLWQALRTGDGERFFALVAELGVTHVLATGEERDWVAQGGVTGLKAVEASEHYTLYVVGEM